MEGLKEKGREDTREGGWRGECVGEGVGCWGGGSALVYRLLGVGECVGEGVGCWGGGGGCVGKEVALEKV